MNDVSAIRVLHVVKGNLNRRLKLSQHHDACRSPIRSTAATRSRCLAGGLVEFTSFVPVELPRHIILSLVLRECHEVQLTMHHGLPCRSSYKACSNVPSYITPASTTTPDSGTLPQVCVPHSRSNVQYQYQWRVVHVSLCLASEQKPAAGHVISTSTVLVHSLSEYIYASRIP